MNEPLAPGSVIGILGGGQLGKMLAQAAAKLGFKAHVFTPDADAPASHVVASHHRAGYDDAKALSAFAREADVVTYEFESIPADSLRIVEEIVPLRPNRRALAMTQDRLHERELLAAVDAPAASWARVDRGAELDEAWHALGGSSDLSGQFLKTRRQGYDGKGQFRISSAADIPAAQKWLGQRDAIIEQAVDFDFEFSMIAVRGLDGSCEFYDPPQNQHVDGRLAVSQVPACMDTDTLVAAKNIASEIMEELDYCGVLAVEFFALRDRQHQILVNEIAPRVHNTGHWTIEACVINQFENHIRAITGWPLGSTERHSNAKMVNIIGPDARDWRALVDDRPARSLHLYGKENAVAGRKMGHYVDLWPIKGPK